MAHEDVSRDVALRVAVEEAKRFVARANDALKAERWASVEWGAVKRSSMDLTRALAVFRRSRS